MSQTQPAASDCAMYREFLSARADGEASLDELARLDDHLRQCVACAAVARRFDLLGRQIRVRAVEPVPNLVGRISAGTQLAVLGRGRWMRPAMLWVAVVLLGQNALALVAGRLDGADGHLARHIGAFGVALAIGFAYAAWKPHRAAGMLPFAAALIFTIAISAIADIADGGRTVLAESAHITEVAGLGLLWMMSGSPGWSRVADRGRHRMDPRPHH